MKVGGDTDRNKLTYILRDQPTAGPNALAVLLDSSLTFLFQIFHEKPFICQMSIYQACFKQKTKLERWTYIREPKLK